MGLFDYIRCKLPGVPDFRYQTKDTDAQWCDDYEIREDGTLWHEAHDIEDRSDPNAEGLLRLVGCMTATNKRWERDLMTGEIRFYTYTDQKDINGSWIEFSAYLENGVVMRINEISKRPAEPAS
jgi:hypothetical protein